MISIFVLGGACVRCTYAAMCACVARFSVIIWRESERNGNGPATESSSECRRGVCGLVRKIDEPTRDKVKIGDGCKSSFGE